MAKVIEFPFSSREPVSADSPGMSGGSSQLWDEEFIRQYDVSGPRYTSYPTALQFHEEFGHEDYESAIEGSEESRKPLSIYVHLPFCASLCYYCACNKIVTQDKARMRSYLDSLIAEIRLLAGKVGRNRPVYQMHWGGGTPNYYDGPELTELMYQMGRHFNLIQSDRSEYSIEIDPRHVDHTRLGLIRGIGFNRISFGIQDFDETVQRGINRLQPYDMIRELVEAARSYRFKSINLDLIYGLPHQTTATAEDTLRRVIELAPDRVSLFNYAHLPARFKSQALLDEAALPTPDEKLRILCLASRMMTDAGYVYIGMDHFARPDDALAMAAGTGTLQRNFQGYTTGKSSDLIGLGVSAISQVGEVYCQNAKSVSEYQALVSDGVLPIVSGLSLTDEDIVRRDIIMDILCQHCIDPGLISARTGTRFEQRFFREIGELHVMIEQGLLTLQDGIYSVTQRGRLVARRICMVFDAHLPDHLRGGRQFSRVL
jgi:oxygen-independent coproporphyrinogen-3 oxidase